MPSRSKAQQALMAIELEKTRKGQPTKLGLAEATLEDFASTPTKKLPKRVAKKK